MDIIQRLVITDMSLTFGSLLFIMLFLYLATGSLWISGWAVVRYAMEWSTVLSELEHIISCKIIVPYHSYTHPSTLIYTRAISPLDSLLETFTRIYHIPTPLPRYIMRCPYTTIVQHTNLLPVHQSSIPYRT